MLRKLISWAIIIFGGWFLYQHEHIQTIIKDYKKEIIVPPTNNYQNNLPVNFVHNVNDFRPQNKADLINIYYTVINAGWSEFTFYCGQEYKDCIKDVKSISSDTYFLSHLNSFVHPYNSYKHLYTTYQPQNKKITLTVFKNYDDYLIKIIDQRIDEIIREIINEDDEISIKIKALHDYLLTNNEYDTLKLNDINDNTYQSNIAYGPLFQGYAVCSGYADTMALLLNKLKIPNIKIATNDHIWNLIYIDQQWLHLDLTWDSPQGEKKKILDDYFLIDTKTLNSYNSKEHQFDQNIYQEAL